MSVVWILQFHYMTNIIDNLTLQIFFYERSSMGHITYFANYFAITSISTWRRVWWTCEREFHLRGCIVPSLVQIGTVTMEKESKMWNLGYRQTVRKYHFRFQLSLPITFWGLMQRTKPFPEYSWSNKIYWRPVLLSVIEVLTACSHVSIYKWTEKHCFNQMARSNLNCSLL
jgi:hypothetical protein